MNNEELLKTLNNNFKTLYIKYLISNEFNDQIILKEDNPIFNVLENHKYIIKKTQNNLKELEKIIDKLNKYYLEINNLTDKNIFLSIYLECQNILENIYELDDGINKHHKIFQNLT